MAKKIGRRVTRYLNSSALSKPLVAFGAATVFMGPVASAQALEAGALPQDPTLAGGNATFAQSGKTLNVTQTSNRAVIDWRSFNIGSEAQTNFNQPNSGSIAVNRVNASANASQIEGGLHANGQVWILNPNGVMFGKTAHVDVAGIVASTANIDAGRFMAGDNRLNLTGADKGSVVNDGSITVGKSGLAAFVAPSVRNSGTITARVGKVALAAGTTFTLDLAGDQLVEIGLGAGKAVVDQSGKIVNPGGSVTLTARAAGQVVDSVVNMSGVTRTASARKVGGDIVLDGDMVNVAGTADASGTSGGNIAVTGKTINVASSAVLRSDAGANGDGGTIKSVAAGQGTYAGSYSAKGGSTSGDGGKIETSGETVNVAADAKIDASASHGNAGTWLLDPLNITIASGTGGGLSGATVTTGAIQSALAGGTSVSITTSQSDFGSDVGDLTLTGTINATSTGNAGLTLTGRHLSATGGSAINIAGGALTLNVNTVNTLADVSNQPTNWIQDADIMVGTVTGGSTIKLGAAIYAPGAVIDRSNLVLDGSAGARINIDPGNGQVIGLGIGGGTSGVTIKGFTIVGEITGSYVDYAFGSGSSRGIFVIQNATNFTVDHNNISNVRTGILVDGRNVSASAITNNVIDNTKTAALLQYTAGEGINISGNSQGVFGNEWGGNFHVNGYYNGTALVSAPLGAASTTVQSALLANSAANAGWAVQDQGYASSNRTVVFVNPTGLDSNQGSAKAKLASIQAGIAAVVSGGTVNVNDGTYVISGSAPYINVNKSLSLLGQSQAGTIIDARSANTYGLRISGPNSNVTVQNFTLYGATGAGNSYGLKAENVTNLVLRNITSQGATKSEFDLNGILGGTLDNLTANGASVASGTPTAGNGISIMDSQNVTLANSTTMNNVWGGLALYQSNMPSGYAYQENNISVAASNNFTEATPVYAQDESTSKDFGTLTLVGYDYIVQSPSAASGYGFFQKTQQGAIDYAAALSAASATVQGYAGNGLAGNNSFTVGFSTGGTALSIQSAVNAASTGATVNVLNGTYVISSSVPYLNVNKSLSLIGQSQAGTIIDAHGAAQYGLRVTADNVSLSNFTLLGVSGSGNSYGIKVENTADSAGSIYNLSISNVTSHGARKAQLDLSGVVGATIDHFTADGTSNGSGSGSQAGAGIAISDSANITITNSSTNNNAYGGLALYETNTTRTQQVTGITIAASNTFNEVTPVYMEDSSANVNFGAVNIAGFDYMIADSSNASDLFTFFQKTQQGAVNYAAARNPASAYVRGWTGTAGNNIFTVGTGSGGAAMSIQSAVNAATNGATINVLDGTYAVPTTLGITKSLSLLGQSQAGTILNAAGATTYSLRVQANNVTLSNFTLMGSTVAGAYGIKVEPLDLTNPNSRINNFAISNVTINGSNKSALDINGAHFATVNNVTAKNAAAGVGIAIVDSSNVTVTNSTTQNNAWGGVRIEQKNATSNGINQQTDAVTVDASNTLTEAVPLYMEDDSASLNFGAVTVGGLDYIVRAPNVATDVFTYFQKTQQGAVNYAAGLGLASAYVQGWNGTAGNNIFTVGTGSGGAKLSLTTAYNAATAGATINVLSGAYTLATQFNIAKSLSLIGAGASTIITSTSTGYGINVTADNVHLSNFTFNGPTAVNTATYGIKVTPDTNVASDRLLGFAIDHVTITGSNRTGLDIHGATGATIDNVSVSNVRSGNGIGLTDSANVTITNTTTSNNAWGGVAIYQANKFYNQQVGGISIDATNSFSEANAVYAEDQSASLDMGALALAGFNYVVKSPNLATDVYTFFQKTQQGAINFATNILLNGGNVNLSTATVQGYAGNSVNGNNIFTVGIGSNGTALSIQSAVNAALTGATVNVLDGTYVIPGGGNWLEINKSLSLVGQSQANTVIDGSGASGYGMRVEADNVSLSNFTLLGATGAGSFGLKVQPVDGSGASSRINNFAISNVTINGAYKSALDVTAVNHATIDHVTAENATHGVGIALVDSADIAVTNSTTLNNAWGGVRIEEKNSAYNQQTTAISVDASNTLNEAVPLYMEDNSGTQDFGTVTVGGLGYIVRADAVSTFFQKTQQNAVDYAAGLNPASAYVEGWSGSAVNNIFTVGISSGGTTLSLQSALNAATTGATVNMLSGSYAGSIVGNSGTNFNFGTVSLGGSFILNGASTLSGNLSASSIALNGAVTLAGATTLNTSAANGSIVTGAINGSTAGGQALTINAGNGTVSLGSLGAITRLGAVTDVSATTLTGGTYNAGSLNFSRALTLGAATALNTNNGNITTASIDGGQALTINAGGGTVSLGSLGAITRLGAVTDTSATTLTGGTYNASSLNFGDALTLGAATALNTNNGNINAFSIDGGQALTINAGSGTVFLGSLGSITRLGAFSDSSATTLIGGTYNADSLSFADLTLASITTLDTGFANGAIVTGAINGRTAGGQTLNIIAGNGTVSLGSLGATTRLGAVNDSSATILTGSTYNANSLNFGQPLTLKTDTTLNTSAANGSIVIVAIDGSTAGGQALTINAGGGTVSLGSLGAITRLGAVTDTSATTLTGGTYNASSLNFGDALTLGAATALNTNNGNINAFSIDGGQALTINAGSGTVFLGSLGSITRLGAFSDSSATTLIGGTYNADSLSFADLTLASITTLDTGFANGSIVTGAINGRTAGGQTLNIIAGNGTVSLGSLGATTRLGAVNDSSATILTGSTYNANSLNFASDVRLTAATTTMDTSKAAGDITVSGNIFGTANGAQNLVLAAGSGTGSASANGNILVQSVGVKGTLALGDMTVSGNNFGAQTVSVGNFKAKLTGNQVFSSHTLNATSVDSTVGGSASGPINSAGAVGLAVTGDVTGAIVGHAVILNAGSITGATVTGTDAISVTANSVGTSTLSAPTVSATAATFNSNVNASNVVLNAGTIDGSTITGSQNITVTAKNVGTSSFTAPTVGATATNFNSAVNASNTANISGGTVAGTFTGGSVTLTGSTSVNATVSAKSTAVSSSVISGSYSGASVSLSGSTSVNATVASNNLSVQSPSGKLAGTWDSISTGSSGTLVVNNQVSVGSGRTNPNQIVVENFVLPTGTRVTSSGSIILPQGLMIGLLSPGGGAASTPKLIQVQDVYSLGSLLSSGYTAIIIDLTGTKKTEDKNLRVSMN